MKKILKIALTAAIACMSAMIMSLCVSAETEDIELPTAKAIMTGGTWGQSIMYDKSSFDCGRITPDTVVSIEYELDGEWERADLCPIELVLQNWSTADPAIWAKVQPFEWDESTASYDYDTMVLFYESDDLSTVDTLIFGDCGVKAKVTKVTLTNITVVEETTTTASETEAVTEAEPETTAAPETEATTTAAASSENSGGGIPLIPIVIGAVVVAVVVVVIIIVKKNKNRFY